MGYFVEARSCISEDKSSVDLHWCKVLSVHRTKIDLCNILRTKKYKSKQRLILKKPCFERSINCRYLKNKHLLSPFRSKTVMYNFFPPENLQSNHASCYPLLQIDSFVEIVCLHIHNFCCRMTIHSIHPTCILK